MMNCRRQIFLESVRKTFLKVCIYYISLLVRSTTEQFQIGYYRSLKYIPIRVCNCQIVINYFGQREGGLMIVIHY